MMVVSGLARACKWWLMLRASRHLTTMGRWQSCVLGRDGGVATVVLTKWASASLVKE